MEAITFNNGEFGLSGVVRDYGTLEYICDRCNEESDTVKSASIALFYIANYHPFFDANKRTALLTAAAILEDRYMLKPPQSECVDAEIRHIACTEGTLEESEDWLRRNIKPIQ